MIDVFKLFAKTQPYVSLYDHCCQTGELAGRLWDLGIINKQYIKREHLCLLAAMHDIGKCHPAFQQKGMGQIKYLDELVDGGYLATISKRIRHELVSEHIIRNKARDFKDRDTAKAFAKILRLHHQKTNYNDSFIPSPKKADWIQAQDLLVAEIQKHFNTTFMEVEFEVSDAVCAMLWGVVILADWITSGGLSDSVETLFSTKSMEQKDFCDMFNIPSLRPLQEKCEELAKDFAKRRPKAIIIEAPMGEGKTEAALYLASQIIHSTDKKGIYIALPTMATARQMESRVSELLTHNQIDKAMLVHSEAWLEQEIDKTEEIDKSWFAPTKRSLLANYAVGTVDQAMMSVLRVRNGILRLLGLHSKVLIIDEVHAYDSYMQTIIFRLLEWCNVLDIPVIILSATLPHERKNKIITSYGIDTQVVSDAYPLITTIYDNSVASQLAVADTYIKRDITLNSHVFNGYTDISALALKAISTGGCACVIMNTVKDAQKVYACLKEKANSDVELLLFHSQFLNKDRKDIENKCLNAFSKNAEKRPHKAVLVATQVVEQSLDIDFDYMISALAPIDLLLQRCGRLHRHQRVRPTSLATPCFTVLYNADEIQDSGIGRVYDAWVVRQTQRVLSQYNNINIPQQIRELIEKVYGETPSNIDMQDIDFKQWLEQQYKEEVFIGKAKSVVFPSPEPDYFFALEDGRFFDETSEELVCSDAVTRVGGNNIKLALLPPEIFQNSNYENPSIQNAKQIMDYSISIRLPQGCNTLVEGDIIECKGYLNGLFVMPFRESFALRYSNNKTTNYKICQEYGLQKEEK